MTTDEFVVLLKKLDPTGEKIVHLEYEVGPPYPVELVHVRLDDEGIVISIC